MEEKSVSFKKVGLCYTVRGKGAGVVLLHGFLESGSIWLNYARQFPKSYKVICPDLPGHGKSGCLGYSHNMEEMAGAVYAIMRNENLRRVILVGHSMGGYVAMAFADLFPDNVKGICLFQSTTKADSPEKKRGRNQAIELVKQNHRSFIRKAIPQLFRPSFLKKHRNKVNQLKSEALKMQKQGVIAALEGMKRRRSREIILRFPPYPVLLLAGRHDKVIPLASLEPQARHSGSVQLEVLENAGHMAYLEDAQNGFERLMKWIRSV